MTYYADAENGDDDWNGLSPIYIEGNNGPVQSLGAAVNRAQGTADIIIVADGTYTIQSAVGFANKMQSRGLTLKSANGPEDCIIDCGQSDEPFHFTANFPAEHPPKIEGFSIINTFRTAVECHGYTNVIIKNCMISPDPLEQTQAAIMCMAVSSPHIIDCQFNGFSVPQGVIECRVQSSPRIENCSFQDTLLMSSRGGAILCSNGTSAVIAGCRIENTSGISRDAAGIRCEEEATAVVTECIITRTVGSQEAGAIVCDDSAQVTIEKCTLVKTNVNTGSGGGILLQRDAKATVTDSVISENVAVRGGGVLAFYAAEVAVRNCTITRNESRNGGGGIYIEYSQGPVEVTNCLITHNRAQHGGGIFIQEHTVRGSIVNCTIADNHGPNAGGVLSYAHQVSIENCIIWNNDSLPISGDISPMTVRFCNLDELAPQLPPLWVGNISAEPLFASPGTDYHLKSEAGRYDGETEKWVTDDVSSPSIDTGDPAYFVGEEPRGSGGRINMGAYGGTIYGSKTDKCTGPLPGDTNNDCKVDMKDFALVGASWLKSTVEAQTSEEPPQ
jgi:hypothetical protein